MYSLRWAVVYGVVAWIVAFVVSVAAFGLHDAHRPLFESIMAVTVAAAVVVLSVRYFSEVESGFVKEGTALGVLWLVINVAIDLPLFSAGPMATPLGEYVADIGVTYLMMPVITIGIGYLLQSRESDRAG